MKAMYLAFAATIAIALLAGFGLQHAGFSASERTAGPSVRLD